MTIAILSDVHADYLHFLKGRDPHAITEFGEFGARRDVVEVILLEQALRLGGLAAHLTFQLADVQSEAASIFISEAVLAQEAFQAVLYTSERSNKARSARNLADIKAARGRADVLLAPLKPTPEGVLPVGQDALVVIPKINVKLLVSRLQAHGAQVFAALERGRRCVAVMGA